jgi:hypothetical protein
MIKMDQEKIDYNSEPVHFCRRCLSLNIRIDSNGEEFCDNCASTTILKTNIFKWEKLYKDMYGRPFLRLIDNRR